VSASSHPGRLPRRPWFEHLIYAPGAYTGYGVKTIPGVREAIEQKKWKEATSRSRAPPVRCRTKPPSSTQPRKPWQNGK
jgi:hypothetical protein